MGEHTKGPWAWYENPSGGCRVQTLNVGIADVLSRAGVPHPVQESCAANARLIAAAPELLEALEGLLREEPNIYEGRLEASLYVSVDALEDARAAIKKARGS